MKMILGLAALAATGALASVQLGSADGASSGSAEASEGASAGATQDGAGRDRQPDVIYVPTPQPVVDEMLRLARLEKGDVLYDLGSGDGRIPITAAKTYGVRAVGIDIDPQRVAEANANARAAGVTDLVTFRQADLFETDLREADVVTLYLLQSLNEKLRPKLMAELEPGSRIVSHAFDMGDWEPERREEVDGSKIFLWTIPRR